MAKESRLPAPKFVENPDRGTLPLDEYEAALREYVTSGGRVNLERAIQLAREAADSGGGVLEIAAVHHEAMLSMLLQVFSTEEPLSEELEAIGRFCASCPAWYAATAGSNEVSRADRYALESCFAESLAEFAVAHRGLQRANVALRRVNEIKELEAKRIASSLHDGAGQLLASVHLAVAQLGSELPPSHEGRLHEVRKLLDEAEQQLRRLSHELRPPLLDEMGLAAALDYLVEGFTKRTGISVTVESLLSARLPVLIETTLYRVVSEALTNVRKHAEATAVRIRLRRTSHGAACLIQDNGVGFRQRPMNDKAGNGGLGVRTIQERLTALNGRLRISSRPGRGTLLAATIPWANRDVPAELATNPLSDDYGTADCAG